MANHIVSKHQQVNKKSNPQKGKGKKNTPKNNRKASPTRFAWIHNRNLQIICGIFMILFAIFLFFSFVSFFSTHDADNTTASSNLFTTIRNGNATPFIGNSMGIIGLYFSFLLIQFGFGIASFGFLFLFILWGIYLISKRALLPMVKSLLSTLLCIIWFSLLMGGLFGKNANWEWLGGNIGNYLSQALIETSVGSIGFALLMIFFAIVILVSFFGLTFRRILPEIDVEDEEMPKSEESEKTGNPSEYAKNESLGNREEGNNLQENEQAGEGFFSRLQQRFHKKEKEPVVENPFKGPLHIATTYPPEQKEGNGDDAEETNLKMSGSNATTAGHHTLTGSHDDVETQEERIKVREQHPFIPGNDILLDESETTSEKTVSEQTVSGQVVYEQTAETQYPLVEIDYTEGHAEASERNEESTDSGVAGNDRTDSEPLDSEDTDTEETQSETDSIKTDDPEAYISSLPPYDPREELIHYQFPTEELLEAYSNASRSKEEREEEIINNKIRIKTILSNFGVEIQSISAIEGPTVTMYEIVPAVGVRINKIKNLEDDIALSVAAIGIRIIAPIPGKGSIGIEIPNSVPKIVPMRDTITSDKFVNNTKMALPVAIGRTISNEVFVFDLAKMPHVLMAGATGQGKSVGLNAVLVSLLYHKHPSELKLVLVDPKKVELTLYSKIERHYLAKLPGAEAIITDTKQVVRTLNSLCIEMDNRYELLKKAQCRNIIEYNEKFKSRHLNPENGHRFLPYIVLVFDEFADCIMTAGREVEAPIARLAQLARAIGIHLIIATQRPSVNIITGVIKANFPARIAFRVSSRIDSRTILDAGGAERLIGKGDMLISTGSEITRIQCALVDTPEIERICEFIGEQHGFTSAYELPEVPEDQEDNSQTADDGETDSFFADAARIVVQTGHGSTSLLQRKLKLGYNRAGRIMDQLEREGIVGAFEGSKAREVLIRDSAQLEEKLKNMGL